MSTVHHFMLLYALVYIVTSSQTAKILLIPNNHAAHVMFFSNVASVLQTKEHDAQVLVSEAQRAKAEKYGVGTISTGNVPRLTGHEGFSRHFFQNPGKSMFTVFDSATGNAVSLCEHVLYNEKLMLQLTQEKFDLVIIDTHDVMRCLYVIPYRLGIPYISMGFRHDPWSSRLPSLPSVEGQHGVILLNEHSTFIDRLQNTLESIFIWLMLPRPPIVNPEFISKAAPNRPMTSFENLYRNSEMWIVNLESICLDFPKAHSFHYRLLGGLGCRPAKPLPADMEGFAEKSGKHGTIVMTFGTALSTIPEEIMDKIMIALGKIKQHVFLRNEGKRPSNKPNNVYLSEWLPQNDLLGHPKTKLFITHGGNNGQLEALYHGVPLLTIPILGDQMYNAQRAAQRGYGLVLDVEALTPGNLVSHINEILNNPRYRENIKQCSKIYQGLPNPQEELVFWVNHVLQFGGSHLKPNYMDAPLWKIFMLDILAFMVAVFAITLVFSYWCCTKTCRRYRQSASSKNIKTKKSE